MNRIEAVIWDLGGVLVRSFDRSARIGWEAQLGLSEYDLERTVFAGEMGRQAALGKATAEDVWAWVGEQLGLDVEQLGELRRDFWRGDGLDKELMAFIRGLKASHKSGLITNAWPEVRQQIEQQWKIADAFDEMVISAEVGLVKPDPTIYQLMLDQLEISAESAVFVDDFEENVAAATRLGMRGLQFHSRQQIIEQLANLLNRP